MRMNNPHHVVTNEILKLFRDRGSSQYGREPVSQQEHALQAAFFAERAGADSSLVVAALLHDIGHLLHDLDVDAPERGIDDRHELLASEWLTQRFGPDIVEPVKLHVAAKRYLCSTDTRYHEHLSPASVLSLSLQGGMMNEDELTSFRANQFCDAALDLRNWDDAAKEPELLTPPIKYFAQHIDHVLSSKPGTPNCKP